MSFEAREKLAELLTTKIAIFKALPEEFKITDYQSLKITVEHDEINDEFKALSELINTSSTEESFKQEFLTRCIHLSRTHADSSLDLFNAIDSPCYELYWEIAELIFKPKTIGEMLKILAPAVTTFLELDWLVDQKRARKEAHNRLHAVFSERLVSDLTAEPNKNLLARYAVCQSTLFNIEALSGLNFNQHLMVFDYLTQHHSKLAKLIYGHNQECQNLESDLLWVKHQGKTPYEILTNCIRELNLGGKKTTGQIFATIAGQVAWTEFLSELKNLPDDLQLQFESLKNNASRKTLKDILIRVKSGDCAESTADELQAIVDNPENETVLSTRPNLSKEQDQMIRQRHHCRRLDTTRSNFLTFLPQASLTTKLANLKISSLVSFISFLISIDTQFYSSLCYSLTFSNDDKQSEFFRKLGDLLKKGILNKTQSVQLYAAICANGNKFRAPLLLKLCAWWPEEFALFFLEWSERKSSEREPGKENFIKFISMGQVITSIAKHPKALKLLISKIPPESISKVIAISANGTTPVHQAATNLEALKFILECFPVSERLAQLRKEIQGRNVLLHVASIQNFDCLELVINAYNAESNLLKQDMTRKKAPFWSPLAYSASHPECFALCLKIFEPKELLWAFEQDPLIRAQAGTTLESFRMMLDVYPNNESRVLKALHRNNKSQSAFEIYVTSNNDLKALELFPPQEHFRLVSSTPSLLGYIAMKEEELRSAFKLYPNQKMLLADIEQYFGIYEETLLHEIVRYAKSLRLVLEVYPNNKRLAAVQKLCGNGYSVLQRACENLESLLTILELLPSQKDRLDALLTPGIKERTILEGVKKYRINFKAIFKYIFSDEITLINFCSAFSYLNEAVTSRSATEILAEIEQTLANPELQQTQLPFFAAAKSNPLLYLKEAELEILCTIFKAMFCKTQAIAEELDDNLEISH